MAKNLREKECKKKRPETLDKNSQAVGEWLTVPKAAAHKGVSQRSVYYAIKQGRLPALVILDRLALKLSDVDKWEPIGYLNRSGAKGRGGRPKGMTVSAETRARMSEAAKKRWERSKKAKSKSRKS